MASKFLTFRAAAGEGENPQLLVYGDIQEWWGDVQAKDFAERLAAIDAPEIDVRINSPGGDVFTAQAIYSSLKRHPARINVYIDGIAASAATIIAMAGDRIIMPENAMMMIHSPLAGVYGNAKELRELADLLDKVRETIVAVYRAQSGLDNEKILELMADDTFLTAAEALELGLIDEVSPAIKIAASRKGAAYQINGLILSADRYSKLPEAWRNAVGSEVKATGEQPGNKPKDEEAVAMTMDEFKEKHPELYAQAMKDGMEQERARIQAIDEMAMVGHEALAAEAKFQTGISAEQFAIEVVRAEKARKEQLAVDRGVDAQAVNKIATSTDPVEDAAAKEGAVIKSIADAFTFQSKRARF